MDRQAAPDFNGNVFRGWNHYVERWDFFIEMTVIHRLHHLLIHQILQIFQVVDHARNGIHIPTQGHFQNEIVAVPIAIGSGAIEGEVLFGCEGRITANVGG